MYQILLVEDDLRIQEVIRDYILGRPKQEMELTISDSGTKALELLYENSYDLVLLDVMLPGADGFTVLKELRAASDTPVIFLTARTRQEDVLHGYALGCDDYVVKPFSLAELYAKMKALLNRAKGTVLGEEITAGKLSLNTHTMSLTVDGSRVELPRIEYQILKILMENKNALVSRDTLIVRIWGYDFDGDERILDNHIKNLRKALGEEGKRIKTVIRRGYKLT